MNERIQQLADEARKHFPKTEMSGEFWVFDEGKFAELIVRECVDIVSGTAVNTPPNDLFYGYNLGVNKAAENIKERFGVKNEHR